jgi:peroxiredoxin (alkyl hydroperoxide reductase subunit C)
MRRIMKTVGDKLSNFSVVGVKPGRLDSADDVFETLTEKSFPGKWKVIVFYPKDFTFVCPTEIVAYDKLVKDFEDRDAVLMTGSTDNEFCKIAWRNAHEDLGKTNSWSFADQIRGWQWNEDLDESTMGLAEQLGILTPQGVALRATFIVDPNDVIQHVTVNNLDVGRSPEETLRILDALQTGELCACNRTVGGATL